MKSAQEIDKALTKVDSESSKYPAMTYEQGIEEALMWVLEHIPDVEFEYGDR